MSCVSSEPAPQQQAIKPPSNAMGGSSFWGISQLSQPKFCPAAQCCAQSVVIPLLAVHKIDKYHRKIPKILLKPRAG